MTPESNMQGRWGDQIAPHLSDTLRVEEERKPKLPASFPSNFTGKWSGWVWRNGVAIHRDTEGVER